jgi:sugar lactone lactonase YvrE
VSQAAPILPCRANLGEGARWDPVAGRLLWVDIYSGVLHISDVVSGDDEVIAMGEPVGAVALTTDAGRYLCAVQSGLFLVGLNGYRRRIAHWAEPGLRLNDCGVDPTGRYWVGSMTHEGDAATGTLFRLDGGELVPVLRDLTISNGMAWDAKRGRMYFVDSATHRLDVLDWERGGRIGGRRPHFMFPVEAGYPDGIAIDDNGTVWTAMWGSGSVLAVDADGRLCHELKVPTPLATSCAFGGVDRQTLFVTTARGDWPDFAAYAEDPCAGAVFGYRLNVAGPPSHAAIVSS